MAPKLSVCYVYGIVVGGIVRYVGLSNDPVERLKRHIRDAQRRPTGLVGPKLASAIRSGSNIRVVILQTCKSRSGAAEAEKVEITRRGGHTERGRQLWNTHEGGIGGSSEASSAVLKARWNSDPEFRKKVSLASSEQLKKQRLDPAFEQKRLAAVKAKARTRSAQQNLALARKNANNSEKQKASIGRLSKLRWQDPEYRSRQIAAIKAAAALRRGAR